MPLQVEPLCSHQNGKYDVVVLAEYNYTAGAHRMLIKRYWVTIYNFSGRTWVRSAIVEDSDGHVFGRGDNIWSWVESGDSFTFYFDIDPDQYFHGDTTITVKTRHGSVTDDWCGETDYLSFDVP